jgi:hypothetical protein
MEITTENHSIKFQEQVKIEEDFILSKFNELLTKGE